MRSSESLDIAADGLEAGLRSGDAKLGRLARKAAKHVERGEFEAAVPVWRQALERLLQVRALREARWLHVCLCDALFRAGDHAGVLEHANAALLAGERDDPRVWLRLGQAAFELGDEAGAGDGLMSGFLLAGPSLFEDEDPKYLQFLAARVLARPDAAPSAGTERRVAG